MIDEITQLFEQLTERPALMPAPVKAAIVLSDEIIERLMHIGAEVCRDND
jgi:hypothetical protein